MFTLTFVGGVICLIAMAAFLYLRNSSLLVLVPATAFEAFWVGWSHGTLHSIVALALVILPTLLLTIHIVVQLVKYKKKLYHLESVDTVRQVLHGTGTRD